MLLRQKNIPFTLTLIGDGDLKNTYKNFIKTYELGNQIFMAGKKTATELRELYRQNDFVVQAPIHEGFGKVPVEGFFHGLIPVLSNVELANVMVANGERGFIFEQNNVESLVNILTGIYQNNSDLANKIILGRGYAYAQTLQAWAKEYAETVSAFYK